MREHPLTSWRRSNVFTAVIVLIALGNRGQAARHPLDDNPQETSPAWPSAETSPISLEPPSSDFTVPENLVDSNLVIAEYEALASGQNMPPISLIDFSAAMEDSEDVVPAASGVYLQPYDLELVPDGLMFQSYLAGEKEPRFAAQWLWDRDRGQVWDTAIGGRWGIVRYGTPGPINPEGFQLDFEGAGLARVDLEEESDLEAVDFRVGIVGTWHFGPWRAKTGYYHLSSHIGDEYLIKNPTFRRRNYVRDALLAALMYDLTEELQVYGEVAYAANANGGAEPLELQFGAQFNKQTATGPKGFPFAAVNSHWRQEFQNELATNIMAGWMWRGKRSNHIFRLGFQHYNGRSLQYELFDRYENLNGVGIWFDY